MLDEDQEKELINSLTKMQEKAYNEGMIDAIKGLKEALKVVLSEEEKQSDNQELGISLNYILDMLDNIHKKLQEGPIAQ